MAAGITFKLKRKAGAFTTGQLEAGEVGVDTTNGFLYVSTDGTDIYRLASSLGKGITVPDPTADPVVGLWRTPVDITISSVESYIIGTTNVVFNINHASTADGTAINVFTSDITLTSVTGQTNNSGFNDNTIPAGSWIWLEIVSISATPTHFHVTINYTEDKVA